MNKTGRYYAGIGSRETPHDVLALMEKIARELRLDGYTLRSGHAEGADQAFERGAMGEADIYLPWASYNDDVPVWPTATAITHPSQQAHNVAAKHHARWDGLKRSTRSLHARNTHIVLGKSCNRPVDFIICWTPQGTVTGGTGQALRIAEEWDIPVRNLAFDDVYDEAFEWAWSED